MFDKRFKIPNEKHIGVDGSRITKSAILPSKLLLGKKCTLDMLWYCQTSKTISDTAIPESYRLWIVLVPFKGIQTK